MSKNKIRRPKKAAPAAPVIQKLATDSDSLVQEFKGLEGKLAQVNQIITISNEQIQKLQQQTQGARAEGQTIIGKLDVLVRILNGMGVDPNNYEPNQEDKAEEISETEPDFSEENEENEAEVVDIKRDAKIEAIKRRLGK